MGWGESLSRTAVSGEPEVPTRPFLVRMDPDLYEALRATAVAEDRSMAQVVRAALRDYIDRREAPDADG